MNGGEIKFKKVLWRHWTGTRSRKKEEKDLSCLENDSERILEQSQSAVERSFLAHKAALMTKIDWIFPVFSLRFVDFAIKFSFRSKFSFHEKPFESSLTVMWFFWTNHNSLLRIATNELASFCIDNILRKMAFFVFAKVGKGRFCSNWERFWNKKAVVVCFFIT